MVLFWYGMRRLSETWGILIGTSQTKNKAVEARAGDDSLRACLRCDHAATVLLHIGLIRWVLIRDSYTAGRLCYFIGAAFAGVWELGLSDDGYRVWCSLTSH